MRPRDRGRVRVTGSRLAQVAPWVRGIQLARDLALLDADAAYYLVDVLTEAAVGRGFDDDPTLHAIGAEMLAIERREGLGEDEAYRIGEAPADWRKLNERWEHRFDVLQADLLRQCDELTMAVELLKQPEDYRERSNQGWRLLMAIGDEDGAV
jgi:hypothetical protein